MGKIVSFVRLLALAGSILFAAKVSLAADLPIGSPAIVLPYTLTDNQEVSRLRPSCFRDAIGDFATTGVSLAFLVSGQPSCRLDDPTFASYHRPDGTVF